MILAYFVCWNKNDGELPVHDIEICVLENNNTCARFVRQKTEYGKFTFLEFEPVSDITVKATSDNTGIISYTIRNKTKEVEFEIIGEEMRFKDIPK